MSLVRQVDSCSVLFEYLYLGEVGGGAAPAMRQVCVVVTLQNYIL
jgi:hypothetical protein